jgi:hypothetical protein
MIAMRRSLLLLLLLTAGASSALVFSGCGGDDKPDAAKPATTAASAAQPGTPASGAGTATPASKPELVAAGTAGAAVLEFWRYMQVGAVPAAVLAYTPAVRRAVGVTTLAGAVAAQRGNVRDINPVVVSADRTAAGTLVIVRGRAAEPGSAPLEASYTLRRTGGRWLIAFDTLADAAIRDYVLASVQGSIDPRASRPGREATKAAYEATERFRAAAF